MKHEIRTVDAERGIVQITCTDERWYRDLKLATFSPSTTWITSYYYKGVALTKWIAETGYKEAQEIKNSKGESGSKVHDAIERLNIGEKLNHTEYTFEEWSAIVSYVTWFNTTNPTILAAEMCFIEHKYNYAGTIDCICMIGDDLWIIDFKTSQNIYKEHELQLSAYKHAFHELKPFIKLKKKKLVPRIGILQLGYARNKLKYKFTEIDDQFKLFLNTKAIWEAENKDVSPRQYEYPTELKLFNI